jgi:hypothetical protein
MATRRFSLAGPLVLAGALVIALVGMRMASAAKLGGIVSHSVYAARLNAPSGAPPVLRWSDFTGTAGTNLSGSSLVAPQLGTWQAQAGTWTRVAPGRAQSSRTNMAYLTTSANTVAASVEATLTFAGNPRSAGVVLNADATTALFVLVNQRAGGTVQLASGPTPLTVLASATGIGTPAVMKIRADATTTTIRVSLNGTVALTYTLTPAQVTAFRSATHAGFGLVADSDATTTFDDFHHDGL